ncbi:MAG TPA: hypothetical protein VFM56_01470 [Solimonas sp.]|nr:hypothetical protein [Solimonas sp.]
MTFVRFLIGLAFALAAAAAVPATAADNPPPPPAQDRPAEEAPAPVYVRPLDEQGRGAAPAAPAPAQSGPTIDSVISMLKKLGMLTASAVLMLVGSALAGVLIAGLVLLARRRRESN